MIINVRGTHGSGKSWVVGKVLEAIGPPDQIIEDLPYELAQKGRKSPVVLGQLHLTLPEPLTVLGKYGGDVNCPGCDRIPSSKVVSRLARTCSEFGNVLMEGIIVSGSWADYQAIVEDGYDFRWLFLDTPLEVCIQQVNRRRAEQGQTKPVNEHNLRDHMRRQERYIRYCQELGYNSRVVSTQQAVDQVLDWIQA